MNENGSLTLVGKRHYARQAERRTVLEEWEASGLSVVEFARERGLDKRSLYRWRGQGRVTAARRAGALVEVPAPTTGAWAAEVATGSATVRLSPAAPPRWAAQLIRELSQC